MFVCVCVCVCVFVRQLLLQLWTDRAETLQVYCPYPHLKPETKIFLIGWKKNFRNFWGIASGRDQMSMCACISITVLIRSSWNFAGVILSLLLTTANKIFFDQTKKKFEKFFLKFFLTFFGICGIFYGVGRRQQLLSARTSLKTPPVGRVFG